MDNKNKNLEKIFNKEKQKFYNKCGTLNVDAKWGEFEKYANNVIDEYYEFIKNVVKQTNDYERENFVNKTINRILVKKHIISTTEMLDSNFKLPEQIDEFKNSYIKSVKKFNQYSNENIIYKKEEPIIELIDFYCEDSDVEINSMEFGKIFYAMELIDIENVKSNENIMKELYLQIMFNLLNSKGNELRMSDLKLNFIYYSLFNIEKVLNASYYISLNCKFLELYKNNEITLNAIRKIINQTC